MPLRIDPKLTPGRLRPSLEPLFELSAAKTVALDKRWRPSQGAPVFTRQGRYTARGWTEWTQGFQFGSALLAFEASGERRMLELGRRRTLEHMAPHLTHTGVHDHGFNNISTYGHLLRLMRGGRIAHDPAEQALYELALKVSGAVQAARWSGTAHGTGFIYSFNGPHSLYIDTMRSLRSLAVAHQLGHVLLGERDVRISLLGRLLEHALTSARFAVYYGTGRDAYDTPGRVAHESLFNPKDGCYRCPSSQQGYSPFSTWSRGLAWALLGFAEQLEFLATLPETEIAAAVPDDRLEAVLEPGDTFAPHLRPGASKAGRILAVLRRAASVTAEFYLAQACADGIPLWDFGAPNLHRLGDFGRRPADPFNAWEPVDSSAAAIAAQGFLRLGSHLAGVGERTQGGGLRQAGLTIARALLQAPYLATKPGHEGLLLHSVYHRPNGWDYVARGQKVPNGESSMWGDYHLLELAAMILHEANGAPELRFFPPAS